MKIVEYYTEGPVTVCILLDDAVIDGPGGPRGRIVARGLAIRSARDAHVRESGRILAWDRACMALRSGVSSEPIVPRGDLNHGWPMKMAFETFKRKSNGKWCAFKAEYRPHITEREANILRRYRNKAKRRKIVDDNHCQ